MQPTSTNGNLEQEGTYFYISRTVAMFVNNLVIYLLH